MKRKEPRRSVVSDLDAAAALVEPGMTVAVGGFLNSSRPMALIRAIARRSTGNLTIIGHPASLDVDLLIGLGLVKKLMVPYVGAESLAAIAPWFRHAAEQGTVQIAEVDEGLVLSMLRAARQGNPFLPWRGGVGTSIPDLNPDLRWIEDPFGGPPLLAAPAVHPDVALIHAAQSDGYGNVQHLGNSFGDTLLAQASRFTIAQVERLVPTDEIRRAPEATSLPPAKVRAVVRLPFGAHPFFSQKHYGLDAPHIREYVKAAEAATRHGDTGPWERWLARFVYGPADHAAYLEQVGIRRLLDLME